MLFLKKANPIAAQTAQFRKLMAKLQVFESAVKATQHFNSGFAMQI